MQTEYRKRREKLTAQFSNDSIAILAGAKLQYRNNDAEFPFRQNSDFYYLSGFSEPDACLVLSKDHAGNTKYILFNQQRDPSAEIWSGKRAGQQGAVEDFGADLAYPIEQFGSIVQKLFVGKTTLYCTQELDLSTWQNTPANVTKLSPLIHELRLIKSEYEIKMMRNAARISAQAHRKVLDACHPGMMEYQLAAVFIGDCLHHGCAAMAYNPIVASGNNACTLHYVTNDQEVKNGDLVLIDAGGEYQNYAADITRTFPANGKFTEAQRAIYALVLQAQLAGIEQIKPGNTWDSVQNTMLQVLVQGLLDLGILKGEVEQLIANKAYKKFYMHSSGHWLGLDVHDAGEYTIQEKWRKFVPGMVLTVEPGIYIDAACDTVAQKWRGIGIRIEDDILVTDTGFEVLSKDAPKQITEIERAAL